MKIESLQVLIDCERDLSRVIPGLVVYDPDAKKLLQRIRAAIAEETGEPLTETVVASPQTVSQLYNEVHRYTLNGGNAIPLIRLTERVIDSHESLRRQNDLLREALADRIAPRTLAPLELKGKD